MKNFTHWPPGLPPHLELPQTALHCNLEVVATRYPQRAAIAYCGNLVSYADLKRQVDALAGQLRTVCGVTRGDFVAIFMQNSPQFIVAFYAILCADAVVMLINTMNLLDEVRHVIDDSSSKVAIFGQELAPNIIPLLGGTIEHAINACYSD